YEGAPASIIAHYNRHAISARQAEDDAYVHGSLHIGGRAQALVKAHLDVIDLLVSLTGSSAEDVSAVIPSDVRYRGWWQISPYLELGHTVSMDCTKADFGDRCLSIQKVIELLKPKP